MSILDAFTEDKYRVGDLQARGYLRTDFPEGYLGLIYQKLKGDRYSNRNPNGTGILESLFFGMDISWDSITSYLSKTPLVIMGRWDGEEFTPAGIIFRTVTVAGGKGIMAGYAFFREYWGSVDAEALGLLGLAFMFQELKLEVVHGIRYEDNHQTKHFLTRFGFKDTGFHPRWEMKKGVLVPCVTSCLLREDFEAYVEKVLIEAYSQKK